MADLKPDRVRAAELAQTGAGRGRARGEKIEREHESTRTLFEHLNPSELAVVPSGMRPKNFVGIRSLASVLSSESGQRREREREMEWTRGESNCPACFVVGLTLCLSCFVLFFRPLHLIPLPT